MIYWLLIIPPFSALTGWIVIRVFFKIIFYPHPKRKNEWTIKLGKLVSAEFQNSFDIEKKISDPEQLLKVMPLIEKHVEEFLQVKLKEEIPMLSMFVGDKTMLSVKKIFMQEIKILFPEIMKELASNFKKNLDLETIVVQKLQEASRGDFQKRIGETLQKEQKLAAILGITIGFIIGVIELIIIVAVAV